MFLKFKKNCESQKKNQNKKFKMLRKIIPSILHFSPANQLRQNVRPLFISATNEAARKGTREKARKKKIKVEIKKVNFIPHNLRKK